MSAAGRVVKMPRGTTVTGQCIEYIQGMSTNASKHCKLWADLLAQHRPTVSGFIHTPTHPRNAVPLPAPATVTLEAILEGASRPNRRRPQGPSASLLHHRQDSVVQRLPCRLWAITHWPPLPLCCAAARSAGRSRQRGEGSRILE